MRRNQNLNTGNESRPAEGRQGFRAFSKVESIRVCVCVCVCECAYALSRVQLIVTPWTVAHQATLSMEFSRQEYRSRLSSPTPRDLSNPEIEPGSFASLVLAGGFFTTVPPGSPDSKQSGLLSQQMVTTLTRLSSIRVLCGAPGPSSQESRILLAPSVSQSQMSLKLYSYLRLTNLCWIFQLPFLQSWRSLKEKPCRTIRVTSWTRTIPCHWDDDSAWCGVVPPVSPHPSFTIRIFCFQLVRRILDLFSSLLGANCMSHSFPPIGGSILYLLPGLLQSCQSCHICYSLHSRKTATTIFLKCKSDTIKSPTYKWVPFQECICKFNLFLSPTKLV